MIDIVIPLGKESRWEDNELRYSLRSIEKFARNVRHIHIIGEKPHWLQNVFFIRHKDIYGHERNIVEKFLIACESENVSDNFLMWNDDFFLTKEIDCLNYPNYCWNDLAVYIKRRHRHDGYRISMQNTLNVLKKKNLPVNMFDIHCPMIYNKAKFKEIMTSVEWRVSNGYVIKSLYANHLQLDGPEMADLKLHGNFNYDKIAELTADRHIFSVSDKAINADMKRFLTTYLPKKSRYEQ